MARFGRVARGFAFAQVLALEDALAGGGREDADREPVALRSLLAFDGGEGEVGDDLHVRRHAVVGDAGVEVAAGVRLLDAPDAVAVVELRTPLTRVGRSSSGSGYAACSVPAVWPGVSSAAGAALSAAGCSRSCRRRSSSTTLRSNSSTWPLLPVQGLRTARRTSPEITSLRHRVSAPLLSRSVPQTRASPSRVIRRSAYLVAQVPGVVVTVGGLSRARRSGPRGRADCSGESSRWRSRGLRSSRAPVRRDGVDFFGGGARPLPGPAAVVVRPHTRGYTPPLPPTPLAALHNEGGVPSSSWAAGSSAGGAGSSPCR